MDLADRLGRFDVLSHLAPEQLAVLAEHTRRLDVAGGDKVLKEGEETADAYLIDSGELRIQRQTPYGLFTLASLGSGDLFGEASFVDRGSRSGDAVAAVDSVLFPLSPALLEGVLEEDQKLHLALYWAFWKSLSSKLRITNDRLAHFFSDEAPARKDAEARRSDTGSFRVGIEKKRDLFREARLAPMEINFLASLSKEKRLDPKQVIFREGDEGDAMYVVLEGRVMISKHITDAGEEALAFLERGDFFGEMALIDDQPRSAQAAADEAGAVVLAIPRAVLQGILDIQKVSSLRLLRILCNLVAKRLREIDDKLVGWYIFSGGDSATA